MDDKRTDPAELAERQAREIEESQKRLRENISKTERLVAEPDEILIRHRREREENN
jgi:hypothetical protein